MYKTLHCNVLIPYFIQHQPHYHILHIACCITDFSSLLSATQKKKFNTCHTFVVQFSVPVISMIHHHCTTSDTAVVGRDCHILLGSVRDNPNLNYQETVAPVSSITHLDREPSVVIARNCNNALDHMLYLTRSSLRSTNNINNICVPSCTSKTVLLIFVNRKPILPSLNKSQATR